MSKKRLKGNKFLVITLIVVISIAIIVLVIKNNKNSVKEVSTDIEKEQKNISWNEKETKEVISNNATEKEENKSSYLDNLNVPTYKKGQKTIKIPILIYHAFRTPIPAEDTYKLFSNQANFDENISTLKNEGYTFITLEDLDKYNNGKIELPEKVCIITMDDGWSGCYLEAYPVLQKYKVPATIFIVNTLVGKQDYFSWEQAKEMYDSGLVKIHCHGYNHSAYDNVSKEKLISDYKKSQSEIEENLKDNNIQKIMAYPAGKSSKNSINWLKEIGFNIQVQTRYGTVNKSSDLDLTNLGRIRAERATGKQILSTINASK